MELLKRRAGIDLLHIPYKGAGLAIQDLMAGRVDMSMMTVASLKASAGKLVPIANADEKRMAAYGDVPTVMEAGVPNYAAIAWWMVLVPSGTPKEAVARLNLELQKALGSPEVTKRTGDLGVEVPSPGLSAEQSRAWIEKERSVWTPLVTSLGLALD